MARGSRAIACQSYRIDFGLWISDFGLRIEDRNSIRNPKSAIAAHLMPYAIALPGFVRKPAPFAAALRIATIPARCFGAIVQR